MAGSLSVPDCTWVSRTATAASPHTHACCDLAVETQQAAAAGYKHTLRDTPTSPRFFHFNPVSRACKHQPGRTRPQHAPGLQVPQQQQGSQGSTICIHDLAAPPTLESTKQGALVGQDEDGGELLRVQGLQACSADQLPLQLQSQSTVRATLCETPCSRTQHSTQH